MRGELPTLIDSHAHTNFEAYDEDRDAMYARAREVGVAAIIEVGVGLAGSRAAIARAAQEPLVFAAAGLHPTSLESFHDDWAPFEELVRAGGIVAGHLVAVGECGLDYYWMKSEKPLQEEAFRRQIRLARDVGLPFIVHCRDAEDDLLPILRDEGYCRGVVHCFGGDAALAAELVESGMHVSFCGNVTYKKAEDLREAARAVPLTRLLLETDSPFLPPQPRRGKRNEPAYVELTGRFLADLYEVPFAELAARTTANACALFSLPDLGSQAS